MTDQIRTMLFVPGNRDGWAEKAARASADAIILDLEDSVPAAEKEAARAGVHDKARALRALGQRVYVRINRSPYLYSIADIMASVSEEVEGLVISKPNGPEDVYAASQMIAEAEAHNGLPQGSTRLLPLLESARALQLCYEIAALPRVCGLIGATARNGDVARSLGFIWSDDGREALYLKSRVVMAARAAGKMAIGGCWQKVHDLDGLRASCVQDRALGMQGTLLLHPSNVAPANEIFSPSSDDIAFYRGMLEAIEKAKAAGRAATIYDGEHIDIAHEQTARQVLALAEG